MPRITVKIKDKIAGETVWIKTNIQSEEIYSFAAHEENETRITLWDDNREPFIIKEGFNAFEKRLQVAEDFIDPVPLAEAIAANLVMLLHPEDESTPGTEQ